MSDQAFSKKNPKSDTNFPKNPVKSFAKIRKILYNTHGFFITKHTFMADTQVQTQDPVQNDDQKAQAIVNNVSAKPLSVTASVPGLFNVEVRFFVSFVKTGVEIST